MALLLFKSLLALLFFKSLLALLFLKGLLALLLFKSLLLFDPFLLDFLCVSGVYVLTLFECDHGREQNVIAVILITYRG